MVTSACPSFTPWQQAVTTDYWTHELDAIAAAFHEDIVAGSLQPVRRRLQALCTWAFWMHPDHHLGGVYHYLLKSGLLSTYASKASVALIGRTLELAPKWAHSLLWLPQTMKEELSFFARHLMKSCRTSSDGRLVQPAWVSRTSRRWEA